MVTSFAKPSLKRINREPHSALEKYWGNHLNQQHGKKAQQKQRSGIYHHITIKVQCAKHNYQTKNINRSIYIKHQNVDPLPERVCSCLVRAATMTSFLNDVRHLVLQILLIKGNQGIEQASQPKAKNQIIAVVYNSILMWPLGHYLWIYKRARASLNFNTSKLFDWVKSFARSLTKHQPPTAFEAAWLTS